MADVKSEIICDVFDVERQLFSGCKERPLINKIQLHGRRRKGTVESFSRDKLRQAPQKKGGEILSDPAGTSTNPTSRINGMATHTQTHTHLSFLAFASILLITSETSY